MRTEEPPVVVMESPSGDSAATARDAAARYLARHCPWADATAVQLVVTELLTNAVRHAGGWWRLRLRGGPEELSVELEDASPALPVARTPDLGGGGGFGWPMVQSLAGRVEVRPEPSGKTVRAMWFRPAPPETA